MNYWCSFDDQEDTSDKLHNYYFEIESPYTPEMILLFYNNLNNEYLVKISKQVEYSRRMKFERYQNFLIHLLNTKTKKTIFNSSKDFFNIWVAKKLENGFESAEISVQYTELYRSPFYKDFDDRLEN